MTPLRALLCCCLATTALAQALPLPHGTGNLTPPPGWTALGAAELAAASRPSDPPADPGRSQLLALVGELQARQRTTEHVVVHAPGGPAGSLRSVSAYSAEATARAADLLLPATVESMRDAYAVELGKAGVAVRFTGHDDPRLFPTGSLRLRFELGDGDQRMVLQHHTVPAGDRVQYFETSHALADSDAAAAIDALLRTFDGARENPGMLKNMLLGGLCGGIAGVLMGVWRKRRLARMANGGTQP